MKHPFPFLGAMLTVLTTFAAAPVIPELKDFRAPVVEPREHVQGFLWLEAESFADYGEWKLDTQFTHKMGSAYLIAAGLGRPIQSATTTIRIPTAGVWHVWVRTKDWLPEFSPGKFAVCINGVSQAVNGASKKDGWRWEKGGDFDLPAGEATIELKDLSGAFARCDALLFTLDGGFKPSDEAEDVAADRLKYTGEDGTIDDGGAYDVVVVGAGPGGMGAALSAARTGARTALVHDRPVMGGNSSCELGVGTDGAAGSHPNGKRNSRESGLCEEANLLRAQANPKTLSAAYRLMAEREPRLEVFSNQRVL
ncbi:MAG: FAD-dependent oxidoreductase, partial [Victivallales bacterium]|nr:FAD-dependent oxidoreductase [Victivallales bacterium]